MLGVRVASYDVRSKGCFGGSSAHAVPALETSGTEMRRERSRYTGLKSGPDSTPQLFIAGEWSLGTRLVIWCTKAFLYYIVILFYICHTYIHDNVYLHQSVGFLP